MSEQLSNKITIGVSACLLSREVRFDGGHKRSRFITDALAGHFEFAAFCPEIAIGLVAVQSCFAKILKSIPGAVFPGLPVRIEGLVPGNPG